MSLDLEKIIIKVYDILKVRFTPTPIPLASDLYLGQTQRLYHRDINEKLFLTSEARAKHIYLIGGTGSGKTTLIKHLIREDIQHGNGFALLEPHSDLCDSVISFIASVWADKRQNDKEAIAKRTILVEPFNSQAIVPFNPLEVSENNPVYPCILELVQVFKQRWADSWGPRMAELLRASLVALAENNLTLLECPSLLVNTRFRNSLLENLQNEEIKEYFLYRYNKLREWDKVKYREPVLNKILEFLTDKNIRYTLGLTKSSVNFREAMDESKWLILNFAKGRLKSNALLLGGLFLAKLQMASLSRVNLPFERRKPFAIYLDEFQNFISQEEGGDVETLLSECRKYGLSLTMAHQNLSQMNQKLLGSILANVNVIVSFRLSRKDAMVIAPEIDPENKDRLISELINLQVGEAYIKVKGKPSRLAQLPYPEVPHVDETIVEEFKRHCASFHARSAEEIEREIQERHQRLGLKQARKRNQEEAGRTRVEETSEEDNEEEGQNEW